MLVKNIAGDKTGLADPILERDFYYLLNNYLTGEGIIDILANVPILIYSFILGMPTKLDIEDYEHKEDAPIFPFDGFKGWHHPTEHHPGINVYDSIVCVIM